MTKFIALLVTVGFSLVGVLADFFLKKAGEGSSYLDMKWFLPGFLLYATTAFGWFYVMKHLKLSTLGIVYSMCMILFLTALGVFYFNEKLSVYEIVGIALALVSIFLLARFN